MSFPLVPLENRVTPEVLQGPLSPLSPYPATPCALCSATPASWIPSVFQAGSHLGPLLLLLFLPGRLFQQMAIGFTPFLRCLFRWHTRKSFLTLRRVKCSCPHRMTLCHSTPALYFFVARITSYGVVCSFVLCIILH